MNNPSNVISAHLFQCPETWMKCEVCDKKNCKLSCRICESVYCDACCLNKDIYNHIKMCAWFWCVIDINERGRGGFNQTACESPMRKFICYGCHKIKSRRTKVCENCKTARYCSVKCQTEDWNALHKKACSTYQRIKYSQGKTKKITKRISKNGTIPINKKTLHWGITKNGNTLPKKYPTKPEAEEALTRLEKNKDGAYYVIAEYSLFSASPD